MKKFEKLIFSPKKENIDQCILFSWIGKVFNDFSQFCKWKVSEEKLETVNNLTVRKIEINLMILFHIHDIQILYQYILFPRKGKKLSDFFISFVFKFKV